MVSRLQVIAQSLDQFQKIRRQLKCMIPWECRTIRIRELDPQVVVLCSGQQNTIQFKTVYFSGEEVFVRPVSLYKEGIYPMLRGIDVVELPLFKSN